MLCPSGFSLEPFKPRHSIPCMTRLLVSFWSVRSCSESGCCTLNRWSFCHNLAFLQGLPVSMVGSFFLVSSSGNTLKRKAFSALAKPPAIKPDSSGYAAQWTSHLSTPQSHSSWHHTQTYGAGLESSTGVDSSVWMTRQDKTACLLYFPEDCRDICRDIWSLPPLCHSRYIPPSHLVMSPGVAQRASLLSHRSWRWSLDGSESWMHYSVVLLFPPCFHPRAQMAHLTVICCTAWCPLGTCYWSCQLWWHDEILCLWCDQPYTFAVRLILIVARLQIPVWWGCTLALSLLNVSSHFTCISSGESSLSVESNKAVRGSGRSGCSSASLPDDAVSVSLFSRFVKTAASGLKKCSSWMSSSVNAGDRWKKRRNY